MVNSSSMHLLNKSVFMSAIHISLPQEGSTPTSQTQNNVLAEGAEDLKRTGEPVDNFGFFGGEREVVTFNEAQRRRWRNEMNVNDSLKERGGRVPLAIL